MTALPLSWRAAVRPLLALLLPLALAACATAPGPPAASATGGEDTVAATAPTASTPELSEAAAVAAAIVAAAMAQDADAPAGRTGDPIALIAARLTPAPRDDLRDDEAEPVPEDAVDRSDLWERVRAGYAIPDLDTELVRRWETYYASRPDYMRRMTERGGRYLFHIVEEIERRGLPTDLALLPFIESAFNPQALSRVRAAGMWQFMPATGRDFELRQNLFRDDRRDVLASTRAALDYLERLHRMFGDWHLALAAYNWGQGNVQRAIRTNEAARRGTGYTDLRMPDETRNYVPKLQAVKNIIADPQRFGIALPPLENHPFFLTVPIVRDIDVALAARLAEMPEDEFRALNPQMNKPVILAAGTPHVLLPFDNAYRFSAALAAHEGPLATWTAWVAPTTMTTTAAASRTGISEARLREVNSIPPGMQVRAGSALLVPRKAGDTTDVSEHLANNGMLALAREQPARRRVVVRAGPKGDTVAAVARRHRVTPAQVAQWNRVSTTARFEPGARIVLMLPPRPQARPQTRTAQTPAANSRTAAARPAQERNARPASRPQAAGSTPAPVAQRHPATGR
jgi:membrane-bound lytic murein transglycosylase D